MVMFWGHSVMASPESLTCTSAMGRVASITSMWELIPGRQKGAGLTSCCWWSSEEKQTDGTYVYIEFM